MDNLMYLFVAFLITWLIIGGYFLTLGRQVQNLRAEIRALEEEGPLAEPGARPAAEQRAQAETPQI